MIRLFALWVPIAAALALALWAVLFDALEPWTHPNAWTRALDDLPPQLLFAATLLFAGRSETPRRSIDQPPTSVRVYWMLLIVLIALGVIALRFIPAYEAQ